MYDSPALMQTVLDLYGVDYTKRMAVCPFHGDTSPSMQIDLESGFVYCYGCGKSYTPVSFVQEAEPHLNTLEVYKLLLQIMPDKSYRSKPKKEEFTCEQMHIQAEDYYYNLPCTNWESAWCPESDYMLERGITAQTLDRCKAKINPCQDYPLIFPLMDNGVFKGWMGKAIDPEIIQKRKYYFNKGFRRSECLCGTYNNRSPLVIVEGYIDMLKLKQAGIKNVVAILGWKLSRQHLEAIKTAQIMEIISALDQDSSGERGTSYMASNLGLNVHRWRFRSDQKDPGDQSEQDIKRVARHFNLI